MDYGRAFSEISHGLSKRKSTGLYGNLGNKMGSKEEGSCDNSRKQGVI